MDWFRTLTGIDEGTPERVRASMSLDGERLHVHPTERQLQAGRFEMAGLDSLRARAAALPLSDTPTTVDEIIADVGALHAAPMNAGALFQAASQFNMLEMVSPDVTPDAGVTGYQYDRTQGPACAIACGAGTIARNYFVPVDGQPGQTAERQLDGLMRIGGALDNGTKGYWRMSNGYALAGEAELQRLSARLGALDAAGRDALMAKLDIGMQWDTAVTTSDARHTVTQAYCSALPLGYCQAPKAVWEPFARLVLDATYEATLHAARINARATGNPHVYLTLVGGGVFANPLDWVLDALFRALDHARGAGLQCHVVSYGQSNSVLAQRVAAHRIAAQ